MKSKLIHLSLLSVLATLTLSHARAGENLVQNPSFEQLSSKQNPRYYSSFFPKAPAKNADVVGQGDLSMVLVDDSTAHSGKYSLRLSSDKPVRIAMGQSKLPFIPGQTIRVTAWMKGENLKATSSMPAGVIRFAFSAPDNKDIHQDIYKQSGWLKAPSSDFDWTELTTTVTVPEGTENVNMQCFLWEGTGTVWFDDLSVEVIDGPANPPDSLPDPDQLRRYQDENAKLPAKEAGTTRVVFLGDSITDMWKLDRDFPDMGYINRGIGGQDTAQMVGRLDQDVLALKPDVVWFLGGTNDIPKKFSAEATLNNVRQIAETCRKNGIQMIICSILPVSDYHKDRQARLERTKLRPPAKIQKLNEGLKKIAKEEGAIYLDLYDVMVDENNQMPANLANDGLHPNTDGYKIMAPYVQKSIDQASAK
ncbi:GDSL-type esterase/lipase family protein [Ruficoccus sp. ZRK36]|uniref:GDSL-type esterase/lipase family protein n=1 Tax=Ruficoccus sp. ZRK36 TaxID=2866311 RepID=UPI001C73CD9A|nr:GDSL-type esterase/lipase family protein [Ruficoccus sp. ZRK36]QYY35445.1 hypothetical protein K0V07_14250 [Ruficoccus sp. ZRK36]